MGGLKPIRLKEVVYTLSPFEQSVMSGLWKQGPYNFVHQVKERGFNIAVFGLFPFFGTMWYANNFKEKEKLEHRY